MNLLVVSRVEDKLFVVYKITGNSKVYDTYTDLQQVELEIKAVQGISVIDSKEEWAKFYKLYNIKNMKDFVTVQEFEILEDTYLTAESYGKLKKATKAKQLWVHFYQSQFFLKSAAIF